eukprot:TRINITY_DN11351_c0_g1_i1.p1 TRINITY_DN11351_c0_g1~~TRINITY_DN11351_c0_g1_i1.p1  ORF type:complete len:662 (+),score=147.00 TRINITY_DN11351_c0_g1_i1:478-2463(+)
MDSPGIQPGTSTDAKAAPEKKFEQLPPQKFSGDSAPSSFAEADVNAPSGSTQPPGRPQPLQTEMPEAPLTPRRKAAAAAAAEVDRPSSGTSTPRGSMRRTRTPPPGESIDLRAIFRGEGSSLSSTPSRRRSKTPPRSVTSPQLPKGKISSQLPKGTTPSFDFAGYTKDESKRGDAWSELCRHLGAENILCTAQSRLSLAKAVSGGICPAVYFDCINLNGGAVFLTALNINVAGAGSTSVYECVHGSATFHETSPEAWRLLWTRETGEGCHDVAFEPPIAMLPGRAQGLMVYSTGHVLFAPADKGAKDVNLQLKPGRHLLYDEKPFGALASHDSVYTHAGHLRYRMACGSEKDVAFALKAAAAAKANAAAASPLLTSPDNTAKLARQLPTSPAPARRKQQPVQQAQRSPPGNAAGGLGSPGQRRKTPPPGVHEASAVADPQQGAVKAEAYFFAEQARELRSELNARKRSSSLRRRTEARSSARSRSTSRERSRETTQAPGTDHNGKLEEAFSMRLAKMSEEMMTAFQSRMAAMEAGQRQGGKPPARQQEEALRSELAAARSELESVRLELESARQASAAAEAARDRATESRDQLFGATESLRKQNEVLQGKQREQDQEIERLRRALAAEQAGGKPPSAGVGSGPGSVAAAPHHHDEEDEEML